jgi:Polysaccharide deacetylase
MSHLKRSSSRWSWNILLFAIFFQAILVAGKPKAKEIKEDGIFTNTTAITSFSPGGQYVMLTFDGGPRSVLTTTILDILHEHYAKATFFVQGSKAFEHPNVIRRFDGRTLKSLQLLNSFLLLLNIIDYYCYFTYCTYQTRLHLHITS